MTNPKKTNIIIFAVFLILSLVATYPVIFKMGASYYGYPGDPEGTMWWFWWLKTAIWHNHANPLNCPLLAAPFGIYLDQSPQNVFYLYFLPMVLLFFNEVVIYNIIIISSFFLAAITMYYLANYLLHDRLCAVFSAIIFAFCPFHFARAFGHPTLSMIQWLPLFMLALFKLRYEPKYRYAVMLGLVFTINFLTDFYFGYILAMTSAAFLLFDTFGGIHERSREIRSGKEHAALSINPERTPAFRPERRRIEWRAIPRLAKYLIIFALVAIASSLPFTYIIFKALFVPTQAQLVGYEGHLHTAKNVVAYSAKPLSYLLPAVTHPVFGNFTESFLGTIFYGESRCEHAIFLGYVPLVLAFLGWKRRKQVLPESRGAVRFLGFLSLFTVIFSFSPFLDIGNMRILLPSYIVYKIAPMFRNPARLGLMTMLAVAALAGFGLKGILEKVKGGGKKIFLTALFSAIVLFEFTNMPPLRFTKISIPEYYTWLAEEKGNFAICEYPISEDNTVYGDYLFYQRIHKRPLVNGAKRGSGPYEITKKIIRLQDPDTPAILAYLGTRYVVVHKERMKKSASCDIIGTLPDFKKNKGLKLRGEYDDAVIYEVIAEPKSL